MKLNEAYIKVEYRLEREGFDNVPALIRYYVGNRKPVSQVGSVAFCAPALRFKLQLLLFLVGVHYCVLFRSGSDGKVCPTSDYYNKSPACPV